MAKYSTSQSKVHIDMTIMPGDVLQEKLLVSLGTGTGPNISTAPGGPLQAIPQFANAGVIQPVDFAYGTDGVDRSVLPAGFFPAATWRGKLYGVPMTIQPVGLYYNPDILTANNIPVPATVEELIGGLEKATKGGISGMPLATTAVVDWWSLWLWAYGGDYDKNGKSLLATKDSEAGSGLGQPGVQVQGEPSQPRGRAGRLAVFDQAGRHRHQRPLGRVRVHSGQGALRCHPLPRRPRKGPHSGYRCDLDAERSDEGTGRGPGFLYVLDEPMGGSRICQVRLQRPPDRP